MGRSKEQQREYMRKYRAEQREKAPVAPTANVTNLSAARNAPSTEFTVYESVEEAVRAEIKTLPLAASRPTEVSRALALAKILDDRQAANRVGAADKLGQVMEALRGGGSVVANPLRSLRDRRTAG